jgi:hypothetical protein
VREDFKGQMPKSMKGCFLNKAQVPRQGAVKLPDGHDWPILRQHKSEEMKCKSALMGDKSVGKINSKPRKNNKSVQGCRGIRTRKRSLKNQWQTSRWVWIKLEPHQQTGGEFKRWQRT